MRILMYATYFPPHYSGAAKQAIALAAHLRNKGQIGRASCRERV